MTFKRVVDSCGLDKTAIAVLYGVSRPTVYAWYANGVQGDSYTVRMARAITDELLKRMRKGDRYVKLAESKHPREDRTELVARLAVKLQSLPPAK